VLKLRSMAVLALSMLLTLALAASAAAAPTKKAPPAPNFGPNVYVFDPSMPTSQIQATADAIYTQQVSNEMGTSRYALLFKPGTYGTAAQPLQLKVGYYTEVAGLGASPDDVVINGKVEVYNRCFDNNGTSNCHALDNFWRTLSNLSIHVNSRGQDGCRQTANFWAVSQAAPMRRVDISGGTLSLMDYCGPGPYYASGGFIADSNVASVGNGSPSVVNGSQQQWLTRDSSVGGWSNAVWNQVFSGVVGAPPDATFPDPPYTTVPTTPVSREKPFLFVDQSGNYNVRVPSARTDSIGPSWAGPGRTIPLRDFLVATPSTPWHEINSALARGMNLLLTPGIYDVARSIKVKRAHTVVLGLGHATLTAEGGAVPLQVADVPGVVIAGVTIDAGPVESPVLLQVGKRHGHISWKKSDALDPTTLSDVYFRVGGPHVGKADIALEVNSDHVLIDNAWVWRADHGIEGLANDTERWNTIIGRNGLVVNGDDVTATGLFVEHFQQYNTVWNGERGRTIMYQSELAYDPPTQADWMHDGIPGWAGYKVGDQVKTHELDGGGVYVFNRNNPSIHTRSGFEVPDTPDVHLHHVMTVNLSGPGTIDHVVNNVGAAADDKRQGQPVYVTDYP
jgi:hypothetical protein